MKLSKFYSDQSKRFSPVSFGQGLNVILAEIRLPQNRDKDTHNLGKTTLGRLLDFGLLAQRDKNFFLFKHEALFGDFVFFLEMELAEDSFVTIRRSVKESSKISFKRHSERHQDLSNLLPEDWDHFEVPFTRARQLLDGILDWRAMKPWTFRKGLGYMLRTQDDYRDVFQLQRFAGAHSDWKPFLADLLGFNAELVDRLYSIERELEEKQTRAQTIRAELGTVDEDASKIDGILLLKRQEVEDKQALLDAFDFRTQDKADTKQLVDEINETIATLNARRYTLTQNRKKIRSSLEEERILFDPEEASRLFKDVGVFFKGQLKKDFKQLIAFNKAITDERHDLLREELAEIERDLGSIEVDLDALGERRSEMLAFLSETDAFSKYKQLSSDLVGLRADIEVLERQMDFLNRLRELRAEVRKLTEQKNEAQTEIEADVTEQSANKNSLFSKVRLFFNEIVDEVIDRKALLSVSPNKVGHLEFKAEILDEASKATSADAGHTYRKLLCIAFDMALVRAHFADSFPKFVFHDGIFESLDDRKKEKLLGIIRAYASVGIQSIVTLIDSDLPDRADDDPPVFEDSEVVVRLHDEGESGRLFKMQAW